MCLFVALACAWFGLWIIAAAMILAAIACVIAALRYRWRERRKPQWRLGTLHDEMHDEYRRRRDKLLAAAASDG